jgi:ABC-type phosphate transport system substrate-binding protein
MRGLQEKQMKSKALVVLLLGFALTGAWQSTAHADSPNDILIVANKSVPINSISTAELKSIFLKKKGRWGNGSKAIPIHAKKGTTLRKAFNSRLLNMDQSREQSYWQEQKIRKGLMPPASFSNLLMAVFKVNGSVSYVFRRDYKQGVVKILAVLASE